MKKYQKLISLLLILMLSTGLLAGCGSSSTGSGSAETSSAPESSTAAETSTPAETTEADASASAETVRTDNIVVLYTNDIHTGISENIGFASLSAYRNAMLSQTPYVLLVDNGDAVQGNYISATSHGTAIIQAMNEMKYDICIPGNHEFDYGLDGLSDIVDTAEAEYLTCNLSYSGSGEDPFAAMKPYTIRDLGGTKVAFVGVTTPDTLESLAFSAVREDGVLVVDFSRSEDGSVLYERIQTAVNDAREEGAEYVILMAHLGIAEDNGVYNSLHVIANTYGIDAVLDGHSHSVIPCQEVKNLQGETVLLTSTGTKLQTFGKLIITPEGTITTELVEQYSIQDTAVSAWITNMEDVYTGILGEPRFTLYQDLSIYNEDGLRLVRVTEVAIGDFVADAYREVLGADIGMCNGGGIRSSLKAGDVSESDLINVNPFGNLMCVVEVTGAELLDMLEYFYQHCSADYIQDGVVVGEFGSFMQISGMKVVIDSSIPTSVIVDENDNQTGVGDTRRVTEVSVLQDGEYVPLDPEQTYSIATNNYMAKNGGSGMANMLADHNLLIDESVSDYEVLLTYATEYLNGDLSSYYEVDDRITIK